MFEIKNMTDILASIFDNYKSKIRNPFFGTIATVWIIRNWEVIYAFFNFDKNLNLSDKIVFIKNYFKTIEFWPEFFKNVGIAFLTLIISFFLLAISRFFTDFYFKIVEPRIITYLDKMAIFTQSDKTRLEKKISTLNLKLENKEQEIFKADELNSNLLINLKEVEEKLSNEVTKSSSDLNHANIKIDQLSGVLTPLAKITKEFDQIISQITPAEISRIAINKRDTSKEKGYRIKTMLLLIENGIITLAGGEDLNSLVNEKNDGIIYNIDFEFTLLGKLFLGYINDKKIKLN